MINEFQTWITEVSAIARRAGSAILEVYHGSADMGITWKEDDSPLTLADQASNAVINSGLAAVTPSYPIVSEENKAIPYAERRHFERYWLVDPLDGTKEFIKRNGEFTVNIALIEGNKPILGVVYIPVTAELYWAARGLGAWRERQGQPEQLSATTFDMQMKGLRVLASRSHISPHTEAFIAQLKEPVLINKGSSIKMLLLAAGEADLYPRLGPTSEWDTAAAQIIVEEAGGQLLEWDSRQPLRYNKEDVLNPNFIGQGRLVS